METETQKEKWRKEQRDIAARVEALPDPPSPQPGRFRTIPLRSQESALFGGVDVSFPAAPSHVPSKSTEPPTDPAAAVYVVVHHPSGRVVYRDVLFYAPRVPYVPSYLAFREIEPLAALIDKQRRERPDVTPAAVLVDGNGIFHPRRAGLACFVGVRTGLPTIGVAKTPFRAGGRRGREAVRRGVEEGLRAWAAECCAAGDEAGADAAVDDDDDDVLIVDSRVLLPGDDEGGAAPPPGPPRADRSSRVRSLPRNCRGFAVPLADDAGAVLACALVGHGGRTRGGGRSREGTGTANPIYVSIGHRCSLQDSVRICAALSATRIPEPVRQADLIGREVLRRKQATAGKGPAPTLGSSDGAPPPIGVHDP